MNEINKDAVPAAMATPSPIDTSIRIGLIGLMTIWCLYIARPFIGLVVWGAIIAIGSYPVYRWMQKKLNLSQGKAAFVFTLAMLALLITPTVVLTGALLDETRVIAGHMQGGDFNVPPPPEKAKSIPLLGEKLSVLWQKAHEDPQGTLGQLEPQLRAAAK